MSIEKAQVIATFAAGIAAARMGQEGTYEDSWYQAETIVAAYLEKERNKASAPITARTEAVRQEQAVASNIAKLLEIETGGRAIRRG